jgi:hypothetical protein
VFAPVRGHRRDLQGISDAGRCATLEPGCSITTTALDGCLSGITRAGWRLVDLDELPGAIEARQPTGSRASRSMTAAWTTALALPIFRK